MLETELDDIYDNHHHIQSPEKITHKTIQKQQSDLLIKAIDTYLFWRENKKKEDYRGYTMGCLTWLRHYTDFGKNRAQILKESLSEETNNPTVVLQEHLKNDSRIHNHSLDTYILEYIVNKKELFLTWFATDRKFTSVVSLEKSQRSLLRELIINSDKSPSHAYFIAKLYEENVSITDHLQRALDYYAIAIRQDEPQAVWKFIQLAQADNNEAQYIIGFHYYLRRGQFSEGINWIIKASRLHHPKAILFLRDKKFNAEEYLLIAKKCEEDSDFEQAKCFYKKACEQGSSLAAMILAHHYQSTEIDLEQAFQFYLRSAQLGNPEALSPLERLGEQTNADHQRKISQLYSGPFFYNPKKVDYWRAKEKEVVDVSLPTSSVKENRM